LSQLTLLMLAGNAIASERVDRSAEFLSSLPASRRQILASKLRLVLMTAATIWGLNVLIGALALLVHEDWAWIYVRAEGSFLAENWFYLLATTVILVGAGWFWSALLDSPAIATSLAIGAALALIWIMLMLRAAAPTFGSAAAWIFTGYLIVGALLFALGSAHYLRRVEP
jgi:ABC-type transport system involved in multi-copper enzyme maturation permease subunit